MDDSTVNHVFCLIPVHRELLPLCHQVMLLLHTIGRGLKDVEVFFTIAQNHWTTIIGKLLLSCVVGSTIHQ